MSELDKFIEQYGNEESNTIQSVVDVMENGTFQEKSDKINDHFQYTADYYDGHKQGKKRFKESCKNVLETLELCHRNIMAFGVNVVYNHEAYAHQKTGDNACHKKLTYV